MKFVVFVVMVVVISIVNAKLIKPLTNEEKLFLRNLVKECQPNEDTKVPRTVITKIRRGEWSEDPKLKKALFCIAKKTNFQDENGELKPEVILLKWTKHYDTEDLEKLKKCIFQYGDAEKTAYELFKCRQHAIGKEKELM